MKSFTFVHCGGVNVSSLAATKRAERRQRRRIASWRASVGWRKGSPTWSVHGGSPPCNGYVWVAKSSRTVLRSSENIMVTKWHQRLVIFTTETKVRHKTFDNSNFFFFTFLLPHIYIFEFIQKHWIHTCNWILNYCFFGRENIEKFTIFFKN